jgi:hypothetical protein
LLQIRAAFIRYLIVCLSLNRRKRSAPPLFQSGAAVSPFRAPHARGGASQHGSDFLINTWPWLLLRRA